jgi:glycosyltransferase involved in cell wall biosynthesis
VYGAISNRKNIEILLNSIYDLESNKIGVIIAGLCDDSVLSVLLEESSKELIKDKRLVVINEYLSEKQEELVFSACDIVWMGYSGHYGMSGVLIKAVWAKRVVIACNTGLIAQFAKSMRAGPVINTEDITEIKNILLLLSSPRVRQKYISKASDSLNEHSWDSFISKVDSAIVRIINSNE